MPEKEVLVVSKAYPPVVGGVETYTEAIVRAYLRKSYLPTVLTQTEGAYGWRRVDYPEGSINLFNAGKRKSGARVSLNFSQQPIVFLRLFRESFKLAITKKFDFVHATTWRSALSALPSLLRMPLVLSVHGREVMNFPFIFKRPMVSVLAKASVVVTVSNATMDVARQALHGARPKGKWITAFNGITYPEEARKFRKPAIAPNQVVKLLSLTRLVERKNILGCVQALSDLRREGVDGFRYCIGGTGPMLGEIKRAVSEAGLEDSVEFLGYVRDEDLSSLYQSADAFLHPQTSIGDGKEFEGFGLVIADAMSFGCTVLAGSAGGPKDFVLHMHTGLVVDGLDHFELKRAVRSLIVDAPLRSKLSAQGQEFALRDLSWDKHIQSILTALGRTSS